MLLSDYTQYDKNHHQFDGDNLSTILLVLLVGESSFINAHSMPFYLVPCGQFEIQLR